MATTIEQAQEALALARTPLRYSVALGENEAVAFWIRDVAGVEELSRPGRFELRFPLDAQTMRGESHEFSPDAVLKSKAVITLERDATVRRFTGIVTEARISATARGVPEVSLVVESRLALLRHRTDVRIHRNQSVPEIVREVCGALSVKVELRLRDAYPPRPYCVQWRESDFDYVSRLMEDEGIFYFFTSQDVMVLGDHRGAYEPSVASLPFRAAAGISQNIDAIHELGARAALTAGKVTLRDWNVEHPSLGMDVTARVAGGGASEWYDFPGEFESPPEGVRKARLVAEAFARRSPELTGRSSAGALVPGAGVALVDAPFGMKDGGYVVRKVVHAWRRNEEGFVIAFEADAEDVVFRSQRTTYVPVLLNPLTGIVCTNGEDVQCDHFGRVKVHFPWDRLRPFDDDCSHWIPVLQENTGGSSAIPRKDWEVLVHFLEGDPDRPVVLGRVYNGEDKFSERLPELKTRSGLKSMTSPSREGSNEIRFDDAVGREQIYVHAERDQTIMIANDRTEDTWNTHGSAVKHDESITIGANATWDIGADMAPSVGHNQSWSVGGNRTLEVGGSEVDTVAGDRSTSIGGNEEVKAGYAVGYSAKNITESIGASMLEEFKAMHSVRIGKTFDLEVGGSLLEAAKQSKLEVANVEKTETIAGTAMQLVGGQLKMRFDEQRHTVVQGFVLATAAKDLTLTGAERFMSVSPTASYTGTADITLKVKDTVVLMKDGLITIKSADKVSLLVSGPASEGASSSTQI